MDAAEPLRFSGRHGVPTVSGLGGSGAAIGYWQKIDVNAFAMERFHNKNTLCYTNMATVSQFSVRIATV